MIAVTPEPVIGTSRNGDRHGPESPRIENLGEMSGYGRLSRLR